MKVGTMRKIFKVRESFEKDFFKAVRKFNRVLSANKMKEIKPIACGKIQIELKTRKGISYFVPGTQYSIEYPEETLKLENLMFIGCYRFVDNAWMRHSETTDEEDNAYICEKNMRCDLCNKHIRTRKAYFFFRNFVTGEYKVYGKGCANATFGFDCENVFNKMADFEEQSTYGYCCGCADDENDFDAMYDAGTLVKVVKTVTDAFKTWVSREKDSANRTSMKIIEAIWGDTELGIDNELDTAKIIEDAKKYWDGQRKKYCSDLNMNAKEILEKKFISRKWCGIFGFAIYRSESEKLKNILNPQSKSNSQFVGEKGERLKGIFTPIASHRYWSYDYRGNKEERSRLVMEDSFGNEYICFCTSMRTIQLMESCLNKPLSCSLTIQRHESYHGVDRTIVNRIKVFND